MTANVAGRRIWWQKADAYYFEGMPTGQRAATYEWTAPKTAKRGDLSLLYATGRQEFAAIARLLTDAVASRKGGSWAYVQILGAEHGVHRSRVGLKANQGEAVNLTDRPLDVARIVSALARENPSLGQRWANWEQQRSRMPAGYESKDLRSASRRDVPDDRTRRREEQEFEDQIRDLLIEKGVARPLDRTTDNVDLTDSYGALDATGRRRMADLVMPRPRTNKLMLIEVKLVARPQPHLDGISQIRKHYRPLLRSVSDPWWQIESYVIARRFADPVLAQARSANVVALEWRDGRLPTMAFRAGRAKPQWLRKLPKT